jgi:hypothetical protein
MNIESTVKFGIELKFHLISLIGMHHRNGFSLAWIQLMDEWLGERKLAYISTESHFSPDADKTNWRERSHLGIIHESNTENQLYFL